LGCGAPSGHGAGRVRPRCQRLLERPGHAERLRETLLLDVTSITNIGILAGALWVAAGRQQTPAL
jgi:hypothetical protein